MNLIKLIILLLSASKCIANIFDIISKNNDATNLVETTVKILRSCYDNKVTTVGVVDTSNDNLCEILKQFLPVALISNVTSDVPIDRGSRHRLRLFVVAASSSTQLDHSLGQIKLSKWWNCMATFLILDSASSKDDGCSKSTDYLSTAWNRNILNALYVCQHRTKGQLIYSFNPYMRKAPNPWHLNDTLPGKNGHPWTLLWREYDDHKEEICVNLEFDKTTDLGGYPIKFTVKEMPPFANDNLTDISIYDRELDIVQKSIFQARNATHILVVHDRSIPGMQDKMGNDITMDTVNGISDMLLLRRNLRAAMNYTISRVFDETALGILTHRSGEKSQLEKLIEVLDRATRYGLLMVIIITVIFFKCCLRQPIGSAILNIFRLIGNTGLTTVPNNQAARLFLAGVYILVVTIIGIYQGKLASLLTKSERKPNVETLQDLIDSGYTIHGHKTYAYLFTDPVFKNRFIGDDGYECEQLVLEDPSSACILELSNAIDAAADDNLYVSRNEVTKTKLVFVIREDWPLEETVNTILGGLVESNIIERCRMNGTSDTLRRIEFKKTQREIEKFEVMLLSQLTFAFVFLGIGLGFAFVCFIFEIIVRKNQ